MFLVTLGKSLHTYANKCLFCDEEGIPRKIKEYKEINTDLPFNYYPCCDFCFKKNPKKRVQFGIFMKANGWIKNWGQGWRRANANDWVSEDV
jgi:hypothetical protein